MRHLGFLSLKDRHNLQVLFRCQVTELKGQVGQAVIVGLEGFEVLALDRQYQLDHGCDN